jgi:hypothetical protein
VICDLAVEIGASVFRLVQMRKRTQYSSHSYIPSCTLRFLSLLTGEMKFLRHANR